MKTITIDHIRFFDAQSSICLDTEVPSIPGRKLIRAINHTIVNPVPPKVMVYYHEGTKPMETDFYPTIRKKNISSIDFKLAGKLNDKFHGQQFENIEEFTEELLKFLGEL